MLYSSITETSPNRKVPILNMLHAFLYTVCFALIPALCISFLFRKKGPYYLVLPLALSLHLGMTAIFAALFRQQAFGFTKSLSIELMATLSCAGFLTLWSFRRRKILDRFWALPALGLLLIVALALLLDNFYILGHHGWAFQEGGLWKLSQTYFRGPLNTDAERNVILVNALLRRAESPFLANHSFAFQLLPFHWIALMASHFPHLVMYPYVNGVIQALNLFFVFLLLLSLIQFRPTILKHPVYFAGFLFIVFCHSDFLNMFCSIIRQGRLGIEADGSYPWMFFRNFSLKLTTLLSPHHVFFFVFVLLALSGNRMIQKRGRRSFDFIMLFLGFLISPIFACFFIPFFILLRLRFRKITAKEIGPEILYFIAIVVAALIAHRGILGFNAIDLFTRKVNGDISILSIPLQLATGWLALVAFPLLWVSCLGVLGIPLTLILWRKFKKLTPLSIYDLNFSFLIAGNLIVYYIIRSSELQRHFTILSCLVGALFTIKYLRFQFSPKSICSAVLLLIIATLGHTYFIYSLTRKPNIVEADIEWKDYFEMNNYLERALKSPPTLAAISFRTGGFPITMEAAPSFATPVDGFVYHHLNEETSALLYKAWAQHHIVPYGIPLGYQYILWGPVEKKVWGNRVESRFIIPENRIIQLGSVALYKLTDKYRSAISPQTDNDTIREALGIKLLDAGWFQEAYDELSPILDRHPDRADLQMRIGRLYLEGGKAAEALKYFMRAARISPSDSEVQRQILAAQSELPKPR